MPQLTLLNFFLFCIAFRFIRRVHYTRAGLGRPDGGEHIYCYALSYKMRFADFNDFEYSNGWAHTQRAQSLPPNGRQEIANNVIVMASDKYCIEQFVEEVANLAGGLINGNRKALQDCRDDYERY